MEAKGGASGDERGGVGSPALDSSDAFSLFHEFINTIDTRLDSQDVEHKQMLDNMKQQRHINDF